MWDEAWGLRIGGRNLNSVSMGVDSREWLHDKNDYLVKDRFGEEPELWRLGGMEHW